MLSLLPARIIRLLEFIGFSGNRELGLLQLQEGASGRSMRSPLCCLTILAFHTYISLILGTGEVNVVEAESLLAPFLQQFPNGSLMLFYHARIELLKGNVEEVIISLCNIWMISFMQLTYRHKRYFENAFQFKKNGNSFTISVTGS